MLKKIVAAIFLLALTGFLLWLPDKFNDDVARYVSPSAARTIKVVCLPIGMLIAAVYLFTQLGLSRRYGSADMRDGGPDDASSPSDR